MVKKYDDLLLGVITKWRRMGQSLYVLGNVNMGKPKLRQKWECVDRFKDNL